MEEGEEESIYDSIMTQSSEVGNLEKFKGYQAEVERVERPELGLSP